MTREHKILLRLIDELGKLYREAFALHGACSERVRQHITVALALLERAGRKLEEAEEVIDGE